MTMSQIHLKCNMFNKYKMCDFITSKSALCKNSSIKGLVFFSISSSDRSGPFNAKAKKERLF